MGLIVCELRKVWRERLFLVLLGVLVCANLLLLWMGVRTEAPAAYRAAGQQLAGKTMEEKGAFIHQKLEQAQSLLKLDAYYRELPYADPQQSLCWREENAQLIEQYEQQYLDKSYELYTSDLQQEYRLFGMLANEYDTVAGYEEFLAKVQQKAEQLGGISVFRADPGDFTGQSIRRTARAYAGMSGTAIDYFPQKGLYAALSWPFTDLFSLAAMLLLAMLLVRRERDSALLGLVRSLPGGRMKTAAAKLAAFALSLLAVLALLYGVNLLYCGAMFGMGPMNRSIQSVPALMECTMRLTVRQYLALFLLAKWAGAFVTGLWVMLAALLARRAAVGWMAALSLPLAMYALWAAVSPSSRLHLLRYANLAGLLQTNELLGSYRDLYCFGRPVSLPVVVCTAAIVMGAGFAAAFCAVFARARLLPAPAKGVPRFAARRTRSTTVWREEGRKLLAMNGAAAVLAVLVLFGAYQGISAQTYLDASEIYYAYYMKHLSGPYTSESRDWLVKEGSGFLPLLAAGQTDQAAHFGELQGMRQKYDVYRRVVDEKVNGYLPEHPGAWLVYDSGYRFLLNPQSTRDLQDTVLAGLACALCFAGLLSIERRGGMDKVLCACPRGRIHTVRAKLGHSCLAAVCIAAAICLPSLWQTVRDYDLPALFAPAMSIPDWQTLPRWITLLDLVLFGFVCRAAACLFMGSVVLWLGQAFGRALPALFVGAAVFCLPALLALSGMEDIQWLGVWPLFHAPGLLAVQGYRAATGLPFSHAGTVLWLLVCALVTAAGIAIRLCDTYENKGRRMA